MGDENLVDALLELVKRNTAPYKWLRGGVTFVKELPKNGNNKLLKRKLRSIN
jgi:acyl-coenzyme A synthetase/AMP-(fatty) acid ligase